MNDWLTGRKTHLTVLFGLVSVLGAFLMGEVTAGEAIARGFELLSISGLRLGVKKMGGQ